MSNEPSSREPTRIRRATSRRRKKARKTKSRNRRKKSMRSKTLRKTLTRTAMEMMRTMRAGPSVEARVNPDRKHSGRRQRSREQRKQPEDASR